MTGVQRLLAGVFLFAMLAGYWVPASARIDGENAYDNLWSKARLYTGDDDSFFQSIDLSGRLQLDLAYVKSQADSHNEFNVRRFRFGFKALFLEKFIFHLEGEFDPQETDSIYARLTDAYLGWAFSETGLLKAGKQSAGFTLDGMTSSKKLLTIERNNLTNNIWFTEEYIPGLGVMGEKKGLSYFAGIFSSGNEDPEFGDFTGGQFGLVTLGHDFAGKSGATQALLRLNLVYNEPDPDNGFTNLLEKIASLNFSYKSSASWGIRADISAASGYFGQPDIWGFVVMPFYDLNERTEVVARYTYVKSDGDNGVRFARYENSLVDGLGDRYTEAYLGLNYYWYGHKLKLQTGVQYLEMRDRANDGGAYSGWSWTTGFRVSW
jgi:phosphate-selective porin OprO/OprP